MQLYQLYFGTNIPNSNIVVSKQQITNFLNSFDQLFGYTLIQVDGYWHGENEISFIVQIAIEVSSLVESIGREYRLTFLQESVMLILPGGTVIFLED